MNTVSLVSFFVFFVSLFLSSKQFDGAGLTDGQKTYHCVLEYCFQMKNSFLKSFALFFSLFNID